MITASWANTANLSRNRQEKVVMKKVHPAIIPGFFPVWGIFCNAYMINLFLDPTIYNIICWVAGWFGQMTHQPTV